MNFLQKIKKSSPEPQKGNEENANIFLMKGASSTFVVSIASILLIFLQHLLLARVMGVAEYGIYSYVINWINVISFFCILGWDGTLIRLIAAYRAKQDWNLLCGVLKRSRQIACLLSLSLALCLILTIGMIQDRLEHGLVQGFIRGAVLLPMLVFIVLKAATLRSLGQVTLSQVPDIILRPLFLIFSVYLSFVLFKRITIDANFILTLTVLVAGIALILSDGWSRKFLPREVKKAYPECRTREWMRITIPMFLISIMHLMLNRVDILAIGIFLDTTQAGIYSAASRIAGLMTFGLVAVNLTISPMISKFYSLGKMEELQKVLIFATRLILILSLPVMLVIFFFGKQMLILFGPEFAQGHNALRILAFAQLVNALTGPVDHLMTMTRHQKEAASVFGLATLLNVFLNIVLIPIFEISGAAMATALSIITLNLMLLFEVRKCLGLKIKFN